MFFCVTERKRRELSIEIAACVASAELSGLLVEHLDDADGASQVVLHRDREDRARAVARGHVPFGVEPRILVGLVDEERLARLRDVAGDALTDLEADGPDLVALHDARDELALPLVEQVERRAIGLDRVVDLGKDELEEPVEIERGAEREAHFTLRDADPPLANELLLHLAELELQLHDAEIQLPRAVPSRAFADGEVRLAARGRGRTRGFQSHVWILNRILLPSATTLAARVAR